MECQWCVEVKWRHHAHSLNRSLACSLFLAQRWQCDSISKLIKMLQWTFNNRNKTANGKESHVNILTHTHAHTHMLTKNFLHATCCAYNAQLNLVWRNLCWRMVFFDENPSKNGICVMCMWSKNKEWEKLITLWFVYFFWMFLTHVH